ncbi:MAG: hypothetical protein KAI43_10735 [Candidatus Aureabacteria bacterium]|nr:hypothetical protein [Candidatus Auribacterota bacterium]
MKKIVCIIALVSIVSLLSGCDNFRKNTRQTGKNINNLVLDGHRQDLYEDN